MKLWLCRRDSLCSVECHYESLWGRCRERPCIKSLNVKSPPSASPTSELLRSIRHVNPFVNKDHSLAPSCIDVRVSFPLRSLSFTWTTIATLTHKTTLLWTRVIHCFTFHTHSCEHTHNKRIHHMSTSSYLSKTGRRNLTVIGRSTLRSFMISILAYKQWRINQTLQARDDPRSGPGKYLSIGFEDFRNLASNTWFGQWC